VNSGSEVAFDLTGGGLQFIFGFWGGNANYMINMPNEFGGANYTDTGVPFTSKGLHVVVTIGADTNGYITYTCALTPRGSAGTIVSGYVRATAGGLTTVPVFNNLELLNNNAGVGPLYDVFFNHMAIYTTPPITAGPFRITSISRQTNDILITWMGNGGSTDQVQMTTGAADGSYSNNFGSLGPQFVLPGTGPVTTNYLDSGGATNGPSRYYRIALVP
jgi:hypothetical protein